jgi:hypothetical protein
VIAIRVKGNAENGGMNGGYLRAMRALLIDVLELKVPGEPIKFVTPKQNK